MRRGGRGCSLEWGLTSYRLIGRGGMGCAIGSRGWKCIYVSVVAVYYVWQSR